MATTETLYTWATYRNINLGTTGQVAKSSAGQVGGWYLFNSAASARFVKLYNKASSPDEAANPYMSTRRGGRTTRRARRNSNHPVAAKRNARLSARPDM